MKWLITGGCGFIGTALSKQLMAEDDQQVRVLDNLSTGTKVNLCSAGEFVEIQSTTDLADWSAPLSLLKGDILDPIAVSRALVGADVVIHLAANTGVPQSVEDPVADCETNVFGTLHLLEGCRKSDVKRFVLASSGAPLGVQEPPLHEEMAPHPASPYGASKAAGEAYCSAYFHCYAIDAVVLRFGNVYGEGSGHKQSVIAKFIKEAIAGKKWEIYGDGSQTRDFIHISDLVTAIRKAAVAEQIGGETFQIATESETTVSLMVELLTKALENEGISLPQVIFGKIREGDVMRNYSDTTKAKHRLGWTPKTSLEDGLQRTLQFFLNSTTETK